MLAFLLSGLVGRLMRRLKFPHQVEGAIVSSKVMDSFERGCVLGMRGASPEKVQKQVGITPWDLRAFFCEGHAMGAAGRSVLSIRRTNPEVPFPGADYNVLRYIGYGFWDGVARKYLLPTLPNAASYWEDVTQYDGYRYLIPNGFAFSTVLLAGRLTPQIKSQLKALKDEQATEAALQGAGRALWFLYLNNFEALRNVVLENEEIAKPLSIGLGVAIAFTQIATLDTIEPALDALPSFYRRELAGGVGIALEIHANNEPTNRAEVEKRLTGNLRDWYDAAFMAAVDPKRYAPYRGFANRLSFTKMK